MINIQNVSSDNLLQQLEKQTKRANGQQNSNPNSLKNSVKKMLDELQPAIKQALPKMLNFDRFVRIALSAILPEPKLLKCTQNSLVSALLTAAQLGLEVNTPLGQAWLIPYGDKCQFQLGYKGLIDLVYRNPDIQAVQAHAVYDEDDFEFEYGLLPFLHHKPNLNRSENSKPICFYGIWKSQNNGFDFAVMSVKEILAIRETSKSYRRDKDKSIWGQFFDEMAKKTVLKRALRYAPLKIESVPKALLCDGTVKDEISQDMSNVPALDCDNVPELETPEELPDCLQ